DPGGSTGGIADPGGSTTDPGTSTGSAGSGTGTSTGSTGSGSGSPVGSPAGPTQSAPNVGTAGNDHLSTDGLGRGAHTMTGFGGDDTYVFTGANSIVDERGGSGFDTVVSKLSVDLNNTNLFKGGIEAIDLTGLRGSSATGNDLDNHISGNSV